MRGTLGSTKDRRSLPGQHEVLPLVTFVPKAGSSAEPKCYGSLDSCPPCEQRWDEAPPTFAAPSLSRAPAGLWWGDGRRVPGSPAKPRNLAAFRGQRTNLGLPVCCTDLPLLLRDAVPTQKQDVTMKYFIVFWKRQNFITLEVLWKRKPGF